VRVTARSLDMDIMHRIRCLYLENIGIFNLRKNPKADDLEDNTAR
jgi:hypothetical protein